MANDPTTAQVDSTKKYLDKNGLARLVANMDVAYAKKSHSHKKSDISDFSHTHTVSDITDITVTAAELNFMDGVTSNVQTQLDGKAASSHNQASNTINAMTGYSKPTSAGAITTSDTLNAAIGKLEKALDGKQASGSYAAASHTHDDRYYTETEMDSKLSGKANTSHGNHVPTTQTADNATFLRNDNTWQKVTPANIGAATSEHNHDSAYAAKSHKHDAGDIASVNASAITGTIAAANLPSFVDDVLEGYYNASDSKFYKTYDSTNKAYSNAYTGETGKIYVDLQSNKTYRWSGSAYVVISETLALGETSSTAYRGDMGAAAYTHAVTNKGAAFSSNLYKITTNAEGHVTAATAVSSTDIANLGVKITDTVYTHPTNSGNKHIPSGGSSGQILRWSADGTAVWGSDNDTWIAFKGATTSAAGTAGYAPAPAAGAANRYLRSDGTWAVPPDNNTTYSDMTGATSSAAGTRGLVPAPAAGKQTSFLRGDGTWVIPENTRYSAGAGVSLSGTTFSNSGVRSVSTGNAKGTISVNTNGTSSDVAVNGLGSAAYTNSSAYATAGHEHESISDEEIDACFTAVFG